MIRRRRAAKRYNRSVWKVAFSTRTEPAKNIDALPAYGA
jgi:hypothetical protein